jgi:predicted DNA-binding transcriptional regulator AlpA
MSHPPSTANPSAFGRLLNATEVCERLGCSQATLYRRVGVGLIPQPVRLGSSSRWIAGEIDGVVALALANRDARNDGEGSR